VVLADISLYSLSVFVHVSAVVVGLGATFAEALLFPVAMRTGTRHVPYVHRVQLAINQRLATPALAVIVLTGIYQTIDGDWDFGSFWISATFAIVIAIGALNGAYFIPTDRKLAAMAERELDGGGRLSDEYQSAARREGMIGALTGILVLLAVFLMVTKPGA
jgi:uncharacterized membrane protein